jgi:hypothetical protein
MKANLEAGSAGSVAMPPACAVDELIAALAPYL